MKNILQINSSINGSAGQSTRLADRFVRALRDRHPEAALTVRDLAADALPHLDGERFAAFLAKPEARTEAQRAIVAESDALIDELRRADVLVLGLPMYNFGVPSQLKAWFDHLARAGVTFRYTADGPVGLLTGKKVYALAARGGRYAGTPADTQSAYVRDFLAFLGLSDLEFIYAEGLAIGEPERTAALAQAERAIRRHAGALRLAA